MKYLSVITLSAFLMFGLIGPSTVYAATTPSLGLATSYAVLASTYTNTTPTTITGDVGFTTPPATPPAGSHPNYGSGAPYATAGIDQGTALGALNAQPCTFTFAAGAINLSTDATHGPIGVYSPGVYCSTGAMNIGGPLTLNGAGTYIFRPVGALTSAVGSVVTLTGASACDVFWTPTQATTLAANTTFAGTVIDNAGITVGANTTWNGRALAFGGTVTTDTDSISAPVCAAPPASLHVIKLVVNGSAGTAVASNFNVHVKNGGIDVVGSPAPGYAATGTLYSLSAGTYAVSEDANASYVRSFSGDCDSSGNITLASGDDKICTIINTDIPLPTPVPAPATGGGGGGSVTRLVPIIGITKVPTPLALPSGSGPVTYDYTVWNVGGQQSLADVSVKDDKCNIISLISGDNNSNSMLDVGETWRYRCSTTLYETTTNTAVATGYSNDTYHSPAVATAIATVVVGSSITPPLINIVKVPSRLTPFPFGGGNVTYSYTVTNPGIVSMDRVAVKDDKCSPVSRTSGDANINDMLDPGEAWIYTCQMNIRTSTRNIATAEGRANGFTALGYAFANVLVSTPALPDTGLPPGNGNLWIISLIGGIILISGLFAAIYRKRFN